MSLVRGSRACGCGDLARGGRQDKCRIWLWTEEGSFAVSRDTMLNAKIAVGLAKTKLKPKLFGNALQVMQVAKYTTMAVALSTRLRIGSTVRLVPRILANDRDSNESNMKEKTTLLKTL